MSAADRLIADLNRPRKSGLSRRQRLALERILRYCEISDYPDYENVACGIQLKRTADAHQRDIDCLKELLQ